MSNLQSYASDTYIFLAFLVYYSSMYIINFKPKDFCKYLNLFYICKMYNISLQTFYKDNLFLYIHHRNTLMFSGDKDSSIV